MTGILLITVLIIWVMTVVTITRWMTGRFKSVALKVVSSWVMFPVLLVAPVSDEVIGGFQFHSFCTKYAGQEIDEQHAMNRRVVYERPQRDQFSEGTALRIRIDPVIYRDGETNQVLMSYHTLHAEGGWLIRTLGISETNAPLLFSSGCAPKEQDAFKKKFNITVIN